MNRIPFSRLLPATALAGALGMVLAWFLAGPQRFWANWILWFLFLSSLGLGCLFLVALEHLVGARWSIPIRRVPERLATLLVPLLPVALLALLAVPALYPAAGEGGLLAAGGKARWLGLPWVSLRAVLCWTMVLLVLANLVRGSLAQDRTRDPGFNRRARLVAPAAMAVLALAITVQAFDWISALTPGWYSDIFGVYLFAGAFLAGLAATTLAVLRLQAQGRLQGLRADHRYNLGAFLFAFTVFWGYIGFSQYLLSWYGNLPEEAAWYRLRLQGAWHGLTIALAVLHFAVPFLALVTRDAKSAPGRLAWVALLMLLAHLLDLYWLVFPALARGVLLSWPELAFAACFLACGLLWLREAFTWGEDMPVGDPALEQGLEFRL